MNLRPLLVLPPLALGVLGFIWMTSRPQPEVGLPPETTLAVRVQQLQPQSIRATAAGFGRVEAEHSWSAIAEVQGRVTAVFAGLDVGSIVEEGTVLVEIDQTDNELSRQKSLANIGVVQADLSELARQEENSQRLLVVERRILEVAKAELARVTALLERGAGTQATVDSAEKSLLAQQTSVTNLTNTLALYPAQRDALKATLAVRQAELAEAERALNKSTISAPFRGRIASMDAEVGQFVGMGDSLLRLESTAAAEIIAEIQPSSFGPVVFTSLASSLMQGAALNTPLDTSQFIDTLQKLGVSAEVELTTTDEFVSWKADIVRLRGSMDAETGTMGIVVRVSDPLVSTPGLRRPPLHSGSFVRVVFSGPERAGSIAVPRHAVHVSDAGRPFVYLVDTDSRLELREVETGQVLGSDILIRSGLTGVERLVLGQPSPPIPGMKLTPVSLPASGRDN